MSTFGVVDFSILLPRNYENLKSDLATRIRVKQKPVATGDSEIFNLIESGITSVLNRAGINRDQISYLLVGGAGIFDRSFWSAASAIQSSSHLNNARVLDYQNGCLSFITGMTLAQGLMRSLENEFALIVCADRLSKMVDPLNPEHWSIASFADSVGIYLVGKQNVRYEFLKADWATRGEFSENLYWDPSKNQLILKDDVEEDRRLGEAYRHNYLKWLSTIATYQRLKLNQIERIFMNQGDHHLIAYLTDALNLPVDKIFRTHEDHGHLGANDCFYGLQTFEQKQSLLPGDYFITAASSIGFSWGAALWKKTL